MKGEEKRTECNEDDHPNPDIDLASTVPVLENSASGINVVWCDDEILHKIVVSESESNGRIDETSSIAGEAALVRDVSGHFTERNHDKVANKTDEAVPEENTERTAPGRMAVVLA